MLTCFSSRELSTEIELMLTTTILPDRCQLVVEETIPKGMYVDPDQLRDLAEFTGLRTYVGGRWPTKLEGDMISKATWLRAILRFLLYF